MLDAAKERGIEPANVEFNLVPELDQVRVHPCCCIAIRNGTRGVLTAAVCLWLPCICAAAVCR